MACPKKGIRCKNCDGLGHHPENCPAGMVIRDEAGRVAAKVVDRPGAINVELKKDRTEKEKLLSMQKVVEFFANRNKTRSETQARSRELKKSDEAHPKKVNFKETSTTTTTNPRVEEVPESVESTTDIPVAVLESIEKIFATWKGDTSSD